MSRVVGVGNVGVSTQVIALYSHYLQEVIAALVAEDFEHGFAMDSQFSSILSHRYRLVVYRRFVGVFASEDNGTVTDAFFATHEDVLPNSVIDRFVHSLPPNHRVRSEGSKDGVQAYLRRRLMEAIQHGAVEKQSNSDESKLLFHWRQDKVDFTIRFDFCARLLAVTELRPSDMY